MRVPAALLALTLAVPLVGARGADQNAGAAASGPASRCPQTTSYLAEQAGIYRGTPLTPRKLTELPPATTYMAVYRQIGGCEAPLTMVEYRNSRRR